MAGAPRTASGVSVWPAAQQDVYLFLLGLRGKELLQALPQGVHRMVKSPEGKKLPLHKKFQLIPGERSTSPTLLSGTERLCTFSPWLFLLQAFQAGTPPHSFQHQTNPRPPATRAVLPAAVSVVPGGAASLMAAATLLLGWNQCCGKLEGCVELPGVFPLWGVAFGQNFHHTFFFVFVFK